MLKNGKSYQKYEEVIKLFYLHCSCKNCSWKVLFSWKPQNTIITVGNLEIGNVHVSWWRFAENVLQVVLFTVFVFPVVSEKTLKQRFYKRFVKNFYLKLIVTTIPINLVPNLILSFFVFLRGYIKIIFKSSTSWWYGESRPT